MRLMRELEATPAANQRRLAERTGMPLGRLSFCHKALMAKGFVKMHHFGQFPNNLGNVYRLIPSGVSENADHSRRYTVRKSNEYEALKMEIEALLAEGLQGHLNSLRKQNQ